MKNVCLLIYDLRSGGAEHVLSDWSLLLSDVFNVFMTIYDHEDQICYPYGGQLVNLNVPSDNKNALTKTLTVLRRAKALSKFVKEKNIDIVISFCNECNLVNTISRHSAKKICSIRSASDVHSNRFVKYVIKSRNNILIIQTEALRKSLIEEYGDKISSKLIVKGNPFDTNRIKLMAKELPPIELQHILEQKKTIVNVASFKKQKNHSGLLRVFELVADRVPDAYLLLVGANSTGLQPDIALMASRSKYPDRIIFAGEQKNPFAIVSRCSVFVLPSLAEGIPNALAEAMICGAPVIASDCPTGPAELLCKEPAILHFNKNSIIKGDYGILVKRFSGYTEYTYDTPNDEYTPFANAIINVITDSEQRENLAKCSEQGSLRFDRKKYKESLVELVKNCLN